MSIEQPIWGIDVSNHQQHVDWSRVKQEGFSFGICKASQGDYFRDKYCAQNLRGMENAGLIPGAYHYLEAGNIQDQLDLFMDQIGGKVEGRLVAVDVELSGWGNDPDANDLWNFVHALYDRIGPHKILLYSGGWFFRDHLGHIGDINHPDVSPLVKDKGCRLWVSRYVNGSGYASVLYQKVPRRWWDGQDGGGFGTEKPSIIQFTDKSVVAGKSPIDANAYSGTMADLRALTTSKGKGKPSPGEHEYLIEVMGESGGGGYTIYFTEKPTPINLESNDAIEQRGSGWRWSGGVARGGRDSVRCGDLPNIVSADHNLKITVDGATKKAPGSGGGKGGHMLDGYTATNEYGLTSHTDKCRQHIEEKFGPFKWLDGYREEGDGTEHHTGRAIDFGVSYAGSRNLEWGDRVVDYIMEYSYDHQLAVLGIIWKARQIGYTDWGYSDWNAWMPQAWDPKAEGWSDEMIEQRDGYHYRHPHVLFAK